MSLTTPTTTEIYTNLIAQIEAAIGQTVPILPKAFVRVLAKALSGVFILLYKYGGWMFLQIFVQTASIRTTSILGKTFSPLVFWGRLVGIGDPVPATGAELEITISVITQSGSIPSGTLLLGASNGVTYALLGTVTLNDSVITAQVRAVADQAGGGGLGAIGNLEVGSVVYFSSTPANVAKNTVVSGIVNTASDSESETAYRQRVLDKFQKRPQGGAYADYEEWAEEAPGIINAYPYTGDPGEVNVYLEATPESSGSADGIPTAAQLAAALDLIELDVDGLATRRPAGTRVFTFPISRVGFDVTVIGISPVSDLDTVRDDIETALNEYFSTIEPYISGLSVPPRRDTITRTQMSAIVEDITTAANATFSALLFVLEGGSGTLGEYTMGEGERAKMSNIIFL